MGLDSIIRNVVGNIIDPVTKSLQDYVIYYAWIGNDSFNKPQFASPISIQAIIEEKSFKHRLPDGNEISQKASILIPRPLPRNGAPNRQEPIDPRDKFVLPSGYTGPIAYIDGVVDPVTHLLYSYEILLG